MSKLEDFEDIPYEEGYANELRYTEKDVQEMIQKTEEKVRNNYAFDKLKYIENEKDFYKGIIENILRNKE